jgi:cytoskeleton protein RodZ
MMMSRRHREEETTEVVVSLPPGKRLQKARQGLGMNIEEMALRLRLPMNILHALEQDDYAGHPTAYMRGYIRAYARMVSLDPETLVLAFNEMADKPAPLQPLSDNTRREIRSDHPLIRAVTYLLIATLAAFFVWWQIQGPETEPVSPINLNARVGDDPADSASMEQENAIPSVLPEESETTAALPLTSAPEPDAAAPPSQVLLLSPDKVSPEMQGQTEAQTQTLTVPAEPLAAAPSGQPATTPAPDNSLPLVIESPEDAWTEVKDARGIRLHFGLIKGGEATTLGGEPPYKIIIGNSTQVVVTYKGEVIDIAPFSTGSVARFTLGDEGAFRPAPPPPSPPPPRITEPDGLLPGQE